MSVTTVLHVVREIRRRTVTSQNRLADATGYHRSTVSRIVKPLVAASFVEKLGKRGRDEPLRLHPRRGILIGVDTTRDVVEIAITDLAYNGEVWRTELAGWGQISAGARLHDASGETKSGEHADGRGSSDSAEPTAPGKSNHPAPPSEQETADERAQHTLRPIAVEVRRKLDEYVRRYGSSPVVGVGLAITGPVARGGISRSSMLLPDETTPWADRAKATPDQAVGVDVRSRFTEALRDIFSDAGRHVAAVDNDAALGALGVFTLGRLSDLAAAADDVLYVRITKMGIGAGIILKGHLVTGADGFAGEIGHLRVRPGPDGPLCLRCGGRNCLETLSSEHAILKQLTGILRADGELTINELLESKHPAVTEALWEAGWWFGVAIAGASGLLNPKRVVLGGDIAEDTRFKQRAWHAIERNTMTEMRGAGVEDFMPTWTELRTARGAPSLHEHMTPELLGALAIVIDELADDYLREPLTRWYDAGGMSVKI